MLLTFRNLDVNNVCGEISLHTLAYCQTWVTYTGIMASILLTWLSCLLAMQIYGVSSFSKQKQIRNIFVYK